MRPKALLMNRPRRLWVLLVPFTMVGELGEARAGPPEKSRVLAQVRFESAEPAKLEPGTTLATTGEEQLTPTVRGAALTLSRETPARFIYDPLTGQSAENTGSLALSGQQGHLELPLNLSDGPAQGLTSFTLEMFVRPTGVPKRTMMAGIKTRQSPSAAEVAVGLRWLPNFHQTYYGGFLKPQDGAGPAEEFSTGHYVTISRLHKDTLGWRHLALVYDADRRTLSVWLDHWQQSVRQLDAALAWDEGVFCIGGSDKGGHFEGLLDELRLTRAALSPAQFLRARAEPITAVSFASPETLLPRGTGYVDVREGFGAVGDGKTDDTAAFQKAFLDLSDKVPGAYYTLYVPPGTYLIRQPLWCSRFIVIQGAGQDRSVLRLADRAASFQKPDRPEPLLRMSSTRGPPGSNRSVNASSIGLYLFDLTLDTGLGNPGAKGLEYHSNNHGSMVNVTIRSGDPDGAGVLGLDLTHHDVGPTLIRNVTVRGFDTAVATKYMEYSVTLEHLTLTGFRQLGLLNSGNIVAVRKLTATGAGPAVVSRGAVSMLVLLDSTITGQGETAAGSTAVIAEGAIYARNVKVAGYKTSLDKRVEFRPDDNPKAKPEWRSQPPETGELVEYVGDHILAMRGTEPTALKLPIEEPPEVAWGDISKDWVSVTQFADRVRGGDWTAAIQAAVDSGAATVYFPQGGYRIDGTVTIGDASRVARLFGMRSELPGPPKPKGNAAAVAPAKPVLVFARTNPARPLVIERLDVDALHHSSPATLVLRHSTPKRYTTAAGVGRLFAEDVGGTDWHFDHPQRVWVRQWNPESHADGPCVDIRGATVWSLGFKTEYQSSKLWAAGGAAVEILGGFIYPVTKGIPRDRPVFKNVDSAMCLIYGQSVYSAGHDLNVLDVQGSDVLETRYKQMKFFGPRARMDLYISRPPAKP